LQAAADVTGKELFPGSSIEASTWLEYFHFRVTKVKRFSHCFVKSIYKVFIALAIAGMQQFRPRRFSLSSIASVSTPDPAVPAGERARRICPA
jgi:hypothetical protein